MIIVFEGMHLGTKAAGRDAKLYHGTTMAGAARILQDDVLRGSKGPKDSHYGISFTRDPRYAATAGMVLLEFDQAALARRFKFKPFDYAHNNPNSPVSPREQAEEVLLGDLPQARKYMTSIRFTSPHAFDDVRQVIQKLQAAGNPVTMETVVAKLPLPMQELLASKEFNPQQREAVARMVAEAGSVVTAGRDAPLYHATNVDLALSIIRSDFIRGSDAYGRWERPEYRTPGVSFTRDRALAERWKHGVVFVFNQAAITNRKKMIPRDYFTGDGVIFGDKPRPESEEFLPGDLDHMSRYLEEIYISPRTLPQLLGDWTLWRAKVIELAKHPKFNQKQKEVILSKNPLRWLQQVALPEFTKVPDTHPLKRQSSVEKDAGRDAPLYHRAPLSAALKIIQTDRLGTIGPTGIPHNNISLTRNKSFAENFRGGGVIFVVDQTKLAQNYKMQPYEYWKHQSMEEIFRDPGYQQEFPEHRRNEAEERVNKPITNFLSYVTNIYLTPSFMNKILYQRADGGLSNEEVNVLNEIAHNPKFDGEQRFQIRDLIRKREIELEKSVTAGRYAPLYHATQLENCLSIAREDTLQGGFNPDTPEGEDPIYRQKGVSLTRDKRYAEKFGPIVFTLDQAKLAQTAKLIPRNYFYYEEGPQKRPESEEFVPGNIENLKRYLMGIHLSPYFVQVCRSGDLPAEYIQKSVITRLRLFVEKYPEFVDNSFQQFLSEFDAQGTQDKTAGRDAPLYHATSLLYLDDIFKDNMLRAGDEHWDSSEEGAYQVPGVSLTRNQKFAESFGEAILVLDQTKLAQNVKMVPRDYFQGDPLGGRTEAEEFVPGDLTNLRRYVTRVYFSPKYLRTIGMTPKYAQMARHLLEDETIPFDPEQKTQLLKSLQPKKPGLMTPRSARIEALANLALREAGREAPLYHGTKLNNVISILESDTLMGGTGYETYEDDFYKQRGVSLSRDRRVAETFNGSEGGVVFVLDQARLVQDHKIRPRDYFVNEKEHKNRRVEREEFVPGDIKPLSRYLARIYFNPERLGELLTKDISGSASERNLNALLDHPLFDQKQAEYIRKVRKNPRQYQLEVINSLPNHAYINIGSISSAVHYLKGQNPVWADKFSFTPDLNSDYIPKIYVKLNLHALAKDGELEVTNLLTRKVGPSSYTGIRLHPDYVAEVGFNSMLPGSPDREKDLMWFMELANPTGWRVRDKELLEELLNYNAFNPQQRELIQSMIKDTEPAGAKTSRLMALANRFLKDAGRDAPLYHATSLAKVKSILEMDALVGAENTHKDEPLEFQQKGVSLTRNPKFAEQWKDGIVFQLDQAALARDYKILPRDYFGTENQEKKKSPNHPESFRRREAEEFVPGSIKPLSRYLTRIFLAPGTLEKRMKADLNWAVKFAQHPKFDQKQREVILQTQKDFTTEIEQAQWFYAGFSTKTLVEYLKTGILWKGESTFHLSTEPEKYGYFSLRFNANSIRKIAGVAPKMITGRKLVEVPSQLDPNQFLESIELGPNSPSSLSFDLSGHIEDLQVILNHPKVAPEVKKIVQEVAQKAESQRSF